MEASAAAPEIVVMKFGGTSVAGPEDLKRAAARIVAAREPARAWSRCSPRAARPPTSWSRWPREISARPSPREMDMLLSTGERISCALCAMAIWDLGHQAISLTGSQAGIVTDSSHTKARILDVRADRISAALEDDNIVLVAGFQGVSDRLQGRDHARPRRLRHDRGRPRRGARRRGLRDLHRRRRRLQRRPANRPRRPQAPRRLLRGDARDVGLGSQGAAAAQRRVRAQPRRPHPLPHPRSRTAPVPSSSPRTRPWNARWSQQSPTPTRRRA